MFGSNDQTKESEVSEYHLCWNNYHASLASFLKLLSQAKDGEELLTDVTISCTEGRIFQAHRLVLATCSTYFRSLFLGKGLPGGSGGGGCQIHTIVYIPDLAGTVMEHLLAFMYRGEITVPTPDLVPLIEAARLLGVQGLTEPQEIETVEKKAEQLRQEPDVPSTSQPEQKEEQEEVGEEEHSREEVEDAPDPVLTIKTDHDETKMEPDDNDDEDAKKEMQQPDSSENAMFYGGQRKTFLDPAETMNPGLTSADADQFHNYGGLPPLPTPLALSLAATKHLSLGFGLEQQQRGLPVGSARRKSSSSCSRNKNRSPRISSSQSSNSSLLYPSVYPPTEDPTRPFACTICPKRFRMKHHLKEHNLIHSGEMPFSCHLCPKRFNRSYTLKNHMKLHSNGAIPDLTHSEPTGLGAANLIVPLLQQQHNYSI